MVTRKLVTADLPGAFLLNLHVDPIISLYGYSLGHIAIYYIKGRYSQAAKDSIEGRCSQNANDPLQGGYSKVDNDSITGRYCKVANEAIGGRYFHVSIPRSLMIPLKSLFP